MSAEQFVDLVSCGNRCRCVKSPPAAGVSRQTIAGSPATTTCRCANRTDTPDNRRPRLALRPVRHQGRALPDIAKEAGMSTANMARWAKTHAIPMRHRAGPATRRLAAQRAVDTSPGTDQARAGRNWRMAAASTVRRRSKPPHARPSQRNNLEYANHAGQPDQPHRTRTRHDGAHPCRARTPNAAH